MNSPFAETILNGSLLLAVPVALLAGLVSFLSPCVLPLVPGYLGYVTGLTGVDLQKQRRGRMLAGIGLFVTMASLDPRSVAATASSPQPRPRSASLTKLGPASGLYSRTRAATSACPGS